MNALRRIRRARSATLRTAFAAGICLAVVACGSTLPSTTPLSTATSRSMARVRPSSSRADGAEPEEHPHLETESTLPDDGDDDDDDDDDSANVSGTPPPGGNGHRDATPE